VRWIFGLDGRTITRPTTTFSTDTAPEAFSTDTTSEAASAPPVTSYTAPQVARLYEYPALDGDGQCLGIIALQGAYSDKDMDAYFSGLGLKKPTIIDIGPNVPSHFWIPNAEVTQDIQIAAAICPRATVVVYHGRSPTVQNYLHVLRTAIFDPVNKPSVLSVSWSFPELEGMGPTPEEAEVFEELFRLAALLGITICSSCGDYGSVTPVVQFDSPTLATTANFAATSPYVLGCGGTSLYAQNGSITQEVVWNRFQELALWRDPEIGENKPFSFSMATGGGISRMFPLPAYQRGAQVPPAVIRNWSQFVLVSSRTFAGRGTPDVAANADLLTGYQTFFGGKPSRGGGTSASAPMWAALVILINEGLARNHGPHARVGWLNPLLYALALNGHAKVVRRITEGNNGGFSASSSVPWNACTGLGSPRGTALAKALGAWPVAERNTQKTGTQDS
jgi:kumamolisin